MATKKPTLAQELKAIAKPAKPEKGQKPPTDAKPIRQHKQLAGA